MLSQDLPFGRLFPEQKVGPLWIGKLHSESFLNDCQRLLLNKKLGTLGQLMNLLNRCIDEVALPAFFYSTEAAARLYKQSPKKVMDIIDKLEKSGYRASRCSFLSYGFRTTAPSMIVENLFQEK